MAIWRVRVACWTPKATNSHSQYVTLTAFPLQQWLYERDSMLCYTHIACVDTHTNNARHGTAGCVCTVLPTWV